VGSAPSRGAGASRARRGADGVVAVNVSGAPSTYQSNVTALQSHLGSTCP